MAKISFIIFFYKIFNCQTNIFKNFILPYFDYCHSLIMYFPSSSLQSLNNCFNLCLYKLFNFKPEVGDKDRDENEEKILREFVEKLQSYDLFTLQSRVYNKLLLFAHGIMTNGRSPVELKSQIISPVPEDDFKTEYMQTQDVYNLRRGRLLVKKTIPETKYELLRLVLFP